MMHESIAPQLHDTKATQLWNDEICFIFLSCEGEQWSANYRVPEQFQKVGTYTGTSSVTKSSSIPQFNGKPKACSRILGNSRDVAISSRVEMGSYEIEDC